MTASLEQLDALYNPQTRLIGPAGTRTSIVRSFEYLRLLLDAAGEGRRERAAEVLAAALALQVRDESAINYGQFPLLVGAPPADLNAALFVMPHLIELLQEHAADLPPALAAQLEEATRRALTAAQRRWSEEIFDTHRDFVRYTNIFLLYIQALLLAGAHFHEERVVRTAVAQWRRWFFHIANTGIDEFLSPTYTNVDEEALRTVRRLAPDARTHAEAEMALEYLCALQHAVAHPRMGLPIAGDARDYRNFLKSEGALPRCVGGLQEDDPWRAPLEEEFRRRSFPYTARGRATALPFRFTSWQQESYGLGSMTGGNYFPQQIHCLAAAGDSPEARALVFMPGRFTATPGFVCQQEGRALCLFVRRPTTYFRTQYQYADAEYLTKFGAYGIGRTGAWQVEEAGSRLLLTAYGCTVTIDPFTLTEAGVVPIALTTATQADLGQVGYSLPWAEFIEHAFPDDAQYFGCLVQVHDAGVVPASPSIRCTPQDRHLTLTAEEALSIHLFLQPSGETTELYDDDWRATPLIDSPAYTLWPDQLLQRMANRG